MDIIKELRFPVNDHNWIIKVLVGGVLVMIPIVNLFVGGYNLKVLKGGISSKSEMPEWNDWSSLFIKGLVKFIIKLVYLFIPIAVILISTGGAIIAVLSGSDIMEVVSISMVTGGSLIGIILMLVFYFFLPMALAMYVNEDCISAAFKFKEIISRIRSVLGDYITVFLLKLILWIILLVLVNIPVVGWLIVIFYKFFAAVIIYNMFGKVFANSTV